MRLGILLPLASLLVVSHGQTLQRETCDARRFQVDVNSASQAVIGGLFEVRTNMFGGYACGQPHKELIQVYEAARWALQRVNTNNIVPGIQLGMKAYDTCGMNSLAKRAASKFYPQFSHTQMACNSSNKLQIGLLGPLSSWTTKPVAEMASSIPASVVSPRAVSPALSDKTKYPYFLRTGPAWPAQIRAMTEVLNSLFWKRIVVVYTMSVHGSEGFELFKRQAFKSGICIAKAHAIPHSASVSDFQNRLSTLGNIGVTAAVFLGSYNEAVNLFDALQNIGARTSQIQWVLPDLNLMGSYSSRYIRGAIYVGPRTVSVTEFASYFSQLNERSPPAENPWFADWYMTQNNCKLPGVNYLPYSSYGDCPVLSSQQKLSSYRQVPYVETTIKAVYAYAKALRQAQQSRCGSGFNGVCPSLQTMTPEEFHTILKNIDFTFTASDGIPSLVNTRVKFDQNGDTITQDFTVWNYNSKNNANFDFREVGRYVNGQLTLNTVDIEMYDSTRQFVLSSLPTSVCPSVGCLYCIIPRDMVEFYYTPGDITLASVLSIHMPGAEPLSCGDLYNPGIGRASAFQYAINTAKTQFPGILNGVTLGGLIADVCGNSETGRIFLNNVLGERHLVRDRNGRLVNHHSIKVMIEGLHNDAVKDFSPLMDSFMIPQVGTAASSVDLRDTDMYKYYTRVISGTDRHASAIVNYLARNDWTMVQVVHSKAGDSFREPVEQLKKIGEIARICVSATYEMGTDGTVMQILDKIRQKLMAKVVVVYLTETDTRALLEALKSASWQRDFILVFAYTHERRLYLDYGNLMQGSIMFTQQRFGVNGFRSWLQTRQPRNSADIPWFTDWYQYAQQCYLDASDKGMYTTECNNVPITSGSHYEDAWYNAFTINAVYTAAKALDDTLKYYCGATYSGVCVQYRAATNSHDILLQYLKNTTFSVESTPFEMMNGEGLTGYEVLTYKPGQGIVQVASWNTKAGYMTVSDSNVVLPPGQPGNANFTSYCSGLCYECAYLSKASYYFMEGDMYIASALGIHDPWQFSPTWCGDMRLSAGIQLGLAQTYAIDMINKGQAPVSLRNITLGNLILDHCSVETRSFDLISYTYTGTSTLSKEDQNKLDASKIVGWISDTTAPVTYMSSPIRAVHVPFVSPLASSTMLSDREMFPTFFRTVHGDLSLSVAMTKLALTLGYKYVIVVYSEGYYGESGLNTFESVSTQEGLCVILKIKMTSNSQAGQILESIEASSSDIVIMWTGGEHTNALFQARGTNLAKYGNFIFIAPMPVMALARNARQGAARTFMLSLKSATVDSYVNFLSSLSMSTIYHNPFLVEYYMVLHECDLPGFYYFRRACPTPYASLTSSPKFSQDLYVIPTINAVYSVVGAIDSLLRDKCGERYDGVCSAFANTENINDLIIEKMETISFKDPLNRDFRYVDREGNAEMELLYWDGANMDTLGEFAGASLRLNELVNLQSLSLSGAESQCTQSCLVCIERGLNFTYIPGDILLGGMFDVHENSLVPFSCGDLNLQNGFQLLEAFNYAIGKVNDKSGQFANILRNVKLGGVGLDACMSTIRSGYLISDIHSRLLTLTRNGQTVNPDDIALYIGGYSSDSSLYMARILKELKLPQISYASSSDSLSDKFRYPYFLRTVPADDKQSLAMVRFLNAKNIRYVQVLHTPDDYGTMGAARFNDLASEEANKICVAQTISFPANETVTREGADRVVRSLLNKPVANTVIVFADQTYINAMLNAISKNTGAIGKFYFIGSETWGNKYGAISGVEPLAVGSLTLGLEFKDIGDFDFHLGQKSPGNYPENPWFSEFYQEMVNCYLSFPDGKHTTPCSSSSENIAAQRDYVQDPGVLHVMNAVFSAAIGLDTTLKAVCGQNYTTVCEQFRNDANRHQNLVSNILKARFVDPSGSNFEFRQDRRDGNKGYYIYDIQKKMTQQIGYTYKRIGSFSSDDALTLDNYNPSWDGSCERPDSCLECPTVRNILPRVMLQSSSSSTPTTILAMYGIHNQGTDSYRCGSLNMNEFYKLLAFIYTMERFFTDTVFKVRGMVIDTCMNSLRIDQDVYSLLSSGTLCNTVFEGDGREINNNTIAGFLTSLSTNVVAANRVLAPRKIPILSSSATSVLLSDKTKYPYFARTVPPDNYQMAVIAYILKQKGWDSPNVIYSQDTYGISGTNELATKAGQEGTCLGYRLSVPHAATVAEAKTALENLANNALSNVIVLIAYDPRTVLLAAKELGILDDYIWIGTETWGSHMSVIDDMKDELLGAITVEVRSHTVTEFAAFMSELKYDNRKNIPNAWFEEFYQTYHKCNLPSAAVNFPSYPNCGLAEQINSADIVSQPFVLNTIAATYAYISSLEAISRGSCSGRSFSECFSDSANWERLFSTILNVNWDLNMFSLNPPPAAGLKLTFNADRFWDLGYIINNLDRVGNAVEYKQVGSRIDTTLTFDNDNYASHKPAGWTPCRPNQICNCAASPIVLAQTGNDTYQRTKPIEPRNYFYYNTRNTTVNGQVQVIYDKIYKWPIWAIATAVPTCLGILVTIFLFCFFLISYPVRGGTTILGFMMMIGILGIYGVNFAFFLPASEATCGAREFVLGVVYAIVFAALLVKAVDNWRFTDNDDIVRKYKGITSACSLFLVALGIVCIQLVIPIEWLILRPPSASMMKNATNIHDWMWCDPHDMYDKSMVLSMVFVIFLVILTGIFAGLAWDSDSNYYESRWILVSAICTAGCFLVWMIVTTNAGPPYRDPAIALANFFNASAILVFMTLRKLLLLCTYKDEEEKQSLGDPDRGNDLYSTVYSNQGFDDAVFQPAPSKLDDSVDNVDGDVGF